MERKTALCFFSLICLLLPAQVWAKATEGMQIEIARQDFLAAEQSLAAGDRQTYLQLKQRLQTYPLLPYLEYQELISRLSADQTESIRAFLHEHADTPLTRQLLQKWLSLLAREQRWKSYLKFSTPGGSVSQQCDRLQALIKTGQQQLAYAKVEPIWLSGHSRPKACDPVFKAWTDADHLTDSLAWRRVELAMSSGKTGLARYLKRFLPVEEQKWVESWISLHQKPRGVKQLLQGHHPMRDEMVVHAIRRLARQDIAKAVEAWQLFHNDPVFTDEQQLKVARTLAAYMVRKPDSQLSRQLSNLVPSHLRLDPKLSDKQFQAALQQNDWNQVLITIDNLSPEVRSKERWRYWRARALIQLGQNGAGETLLQSLAKERSYYGFMAADRLGDRPHFLHQSLTADKTLVARLATLPGLLRARELRALGRNLAARREWNLALQHGSTEELKAAAILIQEWDWPSQTIMTLAKIRYWNDLELRFPLNHREQVDQQARDHGIDSAWIYAILRQESAFATDARSRAGAMGLMQLMPRTARQVAAKKNLGSFNPQDLFLPKVNIELGTSYLSQVYRQLQENPVLATAAYNAGPRRVMKWLPEEAQPTDIWIETVPYRETREYLKRVLAYTLIYNHRLGNTPTQLPASWIKPIEATRLEGDKPARLAAESS